MCDKLRTCEDLPNSMQGICQKRKGFNPLTEVKHARKGPQEISEARKPSLPEYDDDETPQYVAFSQDSCEKPFTRPILDTLKSENPYEMDSYFLTPQEIYTVPAKKDEPSNNFCITESNSGSRKYQLCTSNHSFLSRYPTNFYQNTLDCCNYRVPISVSDSVCQDSSSLGFQQSTSYVGNSSSLFSDKDLPVNIPHPISFNDRSMGPEDILKVCEINSSTLNPNSICFMQKPLLSDRAMCTEESQLKSKPKEMQLLESSSRNNPLKSITVEKIIQSEVRSMQSYTKFTVIEQPNENCNKYIKQLTKPSEESGKYVSGAQTPVTLYPSTYIEKSYYDNNLPYDYIERNKFYSNMFQSNSYDNLSDVDSSTGISCESTPSSSPSRPRHQRLSFPISKKPDSSKFSYFSPQNPYRTAILSYNLGKLYTSELTEKIIDTHCHLDFLFHKENHKGTFSAYRDKYDKEFLACFGGCVANFIEPTFFIKQSNWENMLMEDNIWAAFGVHPHFSNRYNDIIEDKLTEALKHDKVVAVGEIGLDYSGKNNCDKILQQQVFKRQLEVAVKNKKPVIIHCRDAQEDCLRILTENVPRDTRIHRHCFTGNWIEAQEWLDTFPNLFLGFTSLVTFRSVRHLHQVARLTPVDRLLFETDAPYFVPSQITNCMFQKSNEVRKFSHPGMVVHVAAQIAAIRGVKDFPAFLASVRDNTRRMYNI